MAKTITSGVKVTIDTQDLFKFTRTTEQLNATLTKSQKALKLVYNEQGLLTNALGKCVEGLSQSQIKLGLWVDELGRVRTLNDEFAAGLSRSQLEMGYFADELGNVYDAAGDLVKELEAAKDALDDVAEKSGAAKGDVDDLNDAFETLGGGLYEVFDSLREKGDALEKIAAELERTPDLAAKLGEKFDRKLASGARAAGKAIQSLVATLGAANVGLAALAAGAFAAMKAFQKPAIAEYAEGFQDLERAARQAGTSIKSLGDALEFSSALGGKSEIVKTLDEIARIEETGLTQEQSDAVENELAPLRALGADHINKAAYRLANWFTGADDVEKADHMAKITDFVAELAESQKTEAERAAEKIADLQAILDQINPDDEKSRQTIQAEIDRVEEEIKSQEAATLAAKKTEAQEAAGMAEFAAERKPAFEATLENYDATIQSWQKLVEEGNATSEELATAQESLKAKLRDALETELGVDFDAKPEQTADESFATAKAKLDDALAKGVISSENFATAQDQLRDKYAEALATRQETDDAEKSVADKIKEWETALADGKVSQERCNEAIDALEKAARDKAAAELGVDLDATEPLSFDDKMKKAAANLADGTFSQADYDAATSQLREQERAALASETGVDGEAPKSSLDAYNESVAKWQAALEQGVVDQERYDAAVAQLRDAARAQIAGLETSKTANDEYAETVRKLNEARQAELITEEERATLEAEAAKKRDESRKGELADLGYGDLLDKAAELDKAADDEEKTARQRYREELNKYRDALENGRITQEEFDQATAALRKVRNAELKAEEKKASEDAAKKRDDRRSKLGVDALMESLKTPAEKYNETMDEIAASAKAGDLTAKERQALEDKAASDYWEAMESNNRKFGEATKSLSKAGGGKVELAKSMGAGSEALYLAQVRGITANYQNRMQSTTTEIRDVARESLYQSTQTNAYLQTMAEGSGSRQFVFTGN